MACLEMHCGACKALIQDNEIYKVCPVCKSPDVLTIFDEYPYESPSGDDYDDIVEE